MLGPAEGRPLLAEEADASNHQLLDEPDELASVSEEERLAREHALVRKLDKRMSILVLIYILNYIDRNNASVARLRGFEEDLGLTGNQFASILSVLYIGYIIMQIPSNMILERLGKPSIYLPSCMIVWGVISVLTGFTTSFFGALCNRFALGFVEAAFFPGALFLLSKWYTQRELSQRTAILFSGSLISNGFGTLLASGILDLMDGVWGYTAWRWLFFVEGTFTVLVAIAAIYILPDFPETSTGWLSEEEQALAIHRMAEDRKVSRIRLDESHELEQEPEAKHGEGLSTKGLRLAIGDWTVWWLAAIIGFMALFLSFNAFFPTLTATMGYSPTITLLLCAPPWVWSTVLSYFVSRHSDRVGERFWHLTIPVGIGILGYLLAMSTMSTSLRYFSLFLMTQMYSGYVCFLAWAVGSFSGPASKRAVAVGILNSGATIGNILGSYTWPSSWGPTYVRSYMICTAASLVAIAMCYIFRVHLQLMNADIEKKGGLHRYLL